MLKLLVFSLAAPLFAQSGMEAIFAPLDIKGPGAAVLVLKNGKPIFERGYGVRDLRGNAKITSGTNFRLASFSKQLTAMATMISVRDKRFTYESRLTDFFPDFPAWGKAITVRHLLTHTSGLPDYEDLMGQNWTAEKQITDKEVLRATKEGESAEIRARGRAGRHSKLGVCGAGADRRAEGVRALPGFPEALHFRPVTDEAHARLCEGDQLGGDAGVRACRAGRRASSKRTRARRRRRSAMEESIPIWTIWRSGTRPFARTPCCPKRISRRRSDSGAVEQRRLPPHGVSYGFGWYRIRTRGGRGCGTRGRPSGSGR